MRKFPIFLMCKNTLLCFWSFYLKRLWLNPNTNTFACQRRNCLLTKIHKFQFTPLFQISRFLDILEWSSVCWWARGRNWFTLRLCWPPMHRQHVCPAVNKRWHTACLWIVNYCQSCRAAHCGNTVHSARFVPLKNSVSGGLLLGTTTTRFQRGSVTFFSLSSSIFF